MIDFKRLIRPTKRRIIILLILILITLISSLGKIPQIRCYQEHGCPIVQQPFPYNNIFFVSIFYLLTLLPYSLVYDVIRPILSGVFLIDTNILRYYNLIFYFSLILILIYQYILSIFITLLIEKIRGRNG